jgi:hypothetical protein
VLLNSWSIALFICSFAGLFFVLTASLTAIKVLRSWDLSSDTNTQIQLENETWLSATLIQYGLAFQIVSLILLVLAADSFSNVITGAMCATGAFLANDYGIPSLLIKLAAIFFYGFWIVLHRLDITSEWYPLVKIKFVYLLFLLPLMGLDIAYQSLYLVNIEPDIITSCCGVVFKSTDSEAHNLLPSLSTSTLLVMFYGLAGVLLFMGMVLRVTLRKKGKALGRFPMISCALIWLIFYILALLVITNVISSYIYAMPYHRCPFDILQAEYNYIGYPLYFSLILSVFLGLSVSLSGLFYSWPGLENTILIFQKRAISIGLFSLILFLLISSYSPLMYLLLGGEY